MPPPPSRRFPPMSTMAKKSVPQITLDLSTSSSVSSTPQSSIHAQGFEGAEQPASPGTIVTPFSVAPIATPATGQCFGEVDFGPVVRTQQPVPLAHHGAAAAVLRPAVGGINAAMEPADSPKPPAERFPRKDVLKVIDETSKATIQILRVDCDAARNSKKWVTLKDTPCVVEKVIRDTVKAKKEKEMVKRGMNHPNLVKYYGSESHRSGALTIFVEFVNLGSLRDLSTQWRQPSATDPSIRAPTLLERLVVARAVARQALHGLMYYHLVEGMFHRDIKPDNLLVNDAGRLKLCDFDASKKADEWGVTIDGTMTYMAPEVVLQVSDKCTDRMDVWSLGLVLLELLAGKHPFHGVPMSKLLTAEAMGRIVHEELNELSFPDTAKDLIRKCLTTNPCDRISCAQALQHPFLKTTWTEFIDEISASHSGTEEDAATCRELKTHWSTRLNTADPNAVTLATKFGVEVDSAYPELELSTWKSVRRTPPAAEDAGSWKGKIDNVMRRIIHERQRWCEGALAVVLKRLGHRPSSPLVSASATSHPLCCPPVAA